MLGEAPRGHAVAAIALALVLALPPTTANLATTSPAELAASTGPADDRGLAEPLAQLARTNQELAAIDHGHAAGQAWTRTNLADPPTLTDALDTLYAALGLATPNQPETVPTALAAPLATLVALQAHHAADSGPYADLTETGAQAFTLGALEPILDEFEAHRHRAPADPIFVDPLGLVILGGSGDNRYTPNTIATARTEGPLLLLEPAGNDTYDVPIAATTRADPLHDDATPTRIGLQATHFALELGGNDTYNDRTASTHLIGEIVHTILLDERGNDTYADKQITQTTAHATFGFAYLKDEDGDDTYRAHSEGIAHAYRAGDAILWDERGNDTYRADLQQSIHTHAMADSRQAAALLWDEAGSDTYEADLWAYGTSWDDAYARFVDETGDDDYAVGTPNSSFGFHNERLAPFTSDSLLDRGPAQFIDGNGSDAYAWDDHGSGKDHTPDDDETHIDHRPARKWGIFIDCTTPADADRPCPDEQHRATCTILRHPARPPSAAQDPLTPFLDEVADGCRHPG
jgi:hypothetical protein